MGDFQCLINILLHQQDGYLLIVEGLDKLKYGLHNKGTEPERGFIQHEYDRLRHSRRAAFALDGVL